MILYLLVSNLHCTGDHVLAIWNGPPPFL